MSNDDIFLWQDWEIRFDIPTRQLEFRKGEQLLDELKHRDVWVTLYANSLKKKFDIFQKEKKNCAEVLPF